MKVHRITFLHDSGHCLVELEPSALARFFGATYRCVELIRNDKRQQEANGWDKSPWYSKQTNRRLQDIRWGKMILKALDAQPVAPLPNAKIFTRPCTVCGDPVTSSFSWCSCNETGAPSRNRT